jgi:hypothetical protein
MEAGADKARLNCPLNRFCSRCTSRLVTGVLRPRPLHRLRANALIEAVQRTRSAAACCSQQRRDARTSTAFPWIDSYYAASPI